MASVRCGGCLAVTVYLITFFISATYVPYAGFLSTVSAPGSPNIPLLVMAAAPPVVTVVVWIRYPETKLILISFSSLSVLQKSFVIVWVLVVTVMKGPYAWLIALEGILVGEVVLWFFMCGCSPGPRVAFPCIERWRRPSRRPNRELPAYLVDLESALGEAEGRWRRRSWLVVLRARQHAKELASPRKFSMCSVTEARKETKTPHRSWRWRDRSDSRRQDSTAIPYPRLPIADDLQRLVSWVITVEEEDIFREIVGFL